MDLCQTMKWSFFAAFFWFAIGLNENMSSWTAVSVVMEVVLVASCVTKLAANANQNH
jgi:hypothetical protein